MAGAVPHSPYFPQGLAESGTLEMCNLLEVSECCFVADVCVLPLMFGDGAEISVCGLSGPVICLVASGWI